MSSQKYWDKHSDSNDSASLVSDDDMDDEEVMLTKAECMDLFRAEVSIWLEKEGPNLLKQGMDFPKIVKFEPTPKESSKQTASPSDAYKTPRKKVKANLNKSNGGK